MLAPFYQLFSNLNICRNNIFSPIKPKETFLLIVFLEFGKNRMPRLVKEKISFIKEFLIAPILCYSLLAFPRVTLWSHCTHFRKKDNTLVICLADSPLPESELNNLFTLRYSRMLIFYYATHTRAL